MRTRDAALTLSDAAAGGSLTGRDGAVITLPANALVTAAGAAVTGPVQIAITPVDITQPAAGGFPGGFTGLTQTGVSTPIVSFGTTEFVLTSGGQSVQVAPGKTASIELPLYASKRLDGTLLAVGDTTPLWSLDETTGMWVQEGTGTVVASTNAPSGLALRASVGHFSWWNADIGFEPYGPAPQCIYDTSIGVPGSSGTFNTATVCDLLAEIDRTPGGAPSTALAGFARRATVPIAGGVTLPVPANVPVKLTATALNATWGGSIVVNGPVGARAPVQITMRPRATITVTAPEAITLPFDGNRTPAAGQTTAQFTFTGDAAKYARIRVSAVGTSVLTGTVRLLQGTTVLATANIAANVAQLTTPLPTNATYTIEVPAAAAASFRLQADLLGGIQSEAITLPTDITRTIAAYSTLNATLTVSAPTTIYLARKTNSSFIDTRLLGPGGTVLVDGTTLTDATRGTALTLQAAGTYTIEIRPRTVGSAANIQLMVDQTLWTQIAPQLDNAGTSGSGYEIIDAVADRNGKVVVAYTEGVGNSSRFRMRRWSGTAWETAAADLTIAQPCSGSGTMMSVTFDNANNPIVVHGNRTDPSSATFVSARRYIAGAWQPLGPNNGTLPVTSSFGGACSSYPAVTVGTDGTPLVAYQSDNNIVVQRFDGTNWVGLATPATGDLFALQNGTFDLKVDPTGRVWFVTGSPSFSGVPALVRRFNTTTSAWETIGGTLPQPNTLGLDKPRLRFTDAGLPVIAWNAAVGSGGIASAGVAVYRYDGTTWSTAGGYQVPNNRFQGYVNDPGFALQGGDALVAIPLVSPSCCGMAVQRNTATGWGPLGPGFGIIPQFFPGAINDTQSRGSKLVSIGGEVYLAMVTIQPVNATNQFRIVLMKRVAN